MQDEVYYNYTNNVQRGPAVCCIFPDWPILILNLQETLRQHARRRTNILQLHHHHTSK